MPRGQTLHLVLAHLSDTERRWPMILLMAMWSSMADLVLTPMSSWVILGSFWGARGQTLRLVVARLSDTKCRWSTTRLMAMWSCLEGQLMEYPWVILGSFWAVRGQTLHPVVARLRDTEHRWLMMSRMAMWFS